MAPSGGEAFLLVIWIGGILGCPWNRPNALVHCCVATFASENVEVRSCWLWWMLQSDDRHKKNSNIGVNSHANLLHSNIFQFPQLIAYEFNDKNIEIVCRQICQQVRNFQEVPFSGDIFKMTYTARKSNK